ncbi:hypothetical protein AV530_013861 [Patagioenas fasciata monilis]|uniref:Ig-like domain-containing protein n=1 Tax=Patagioenas fasciata monilis TaxID=372326 RepID=A0A1V4L287_PATFA|nr:hypothetical protein AV530_013861 [Patagioenas fasciata monilis]
MLTAMCMGLLPIVAVTGQMVLEQHTRDLAVREGDGVTFQCSMSGDRMSSSTFVDSSNDHVSFLLTAAVTGQVVSEQHTRNVAVQEGDGVTFQCSMSGDSMSSYYMFWYRMGEGLGGTSTVSSDRSADREDVGSDLQQGERSWRGVRQSEFGHVDCGVHGVIAHGRALWEQPSSSSAVSQTPPSSLALLLSGDMQGTCLLLPHLGV